MKDILRNSFLWLTELVSGFFRWSWGKFRAWSGNMSSEDRVGMYSTVCIHLGLLIVLLVWQISSALRDDTSYLFDFSQIEAKEREQEVIDFKESISRRLDELIGAAVPVAPSDIRNVAVDALASEGHLRDDRGTDVEELYNDVARVNAELAQRLNPGVEEFVELGQEAGAGVDEVKEEAKPYSGPSVVSYSLDGRKAVELSIPSYRCLGGGDVVVVIKVNSAGEVVQAKVSDDFSSSDKCLRSFAVRAARLSRFTASSSAPNPQIGEIVYRFIAQ